MKALVLALLGFAALTTISGPVRAAESVVWVGKGGLPSITKALERARPGTTVKVRAGVYTENIHFTRSGKPDAPIVLVSADGPGAAVIRPADRSQRTVRGFGVENIVLDGFEVVGSDRDAITFTQAGADFTRLARNIIIQNNYVHDAGDDGIKIAQADNVRILNNIITRTGGQGIDFVAVNDSVIAFNEVSATPSNSLIMVKGGSARVAIHDNIVHRSDRAKTTNGILIGGSTEKPYFRPGQDTAEAYEVTAFNNEIYDVERGIQFMGARDSAAYHNELRAIRGGDVDVSASTVWHDPPLPSANIYVFENGVSKGGWLNVQHGQAEGLAVQGNVVGVPPAGPLGTAETPADGRKPG
ncbi:MAG: right-handed parallel beta-helix repeat-containing protein [Rhodospirillaceae bacterium]